MPRVCAALREHVQHAAGRTAVFGAVAGGLDLHFVHEVRDEELAGSADDGVSRFHAVDDDPVLGAARAVNRDSTELPLVVGPGRLGCERREVPAPRQLLDLLVVEIRGARALCHGDHGRLADDFDRFVGPRWLEHRDRW